MKNMIGPRILVMVGVIACAVFVVPQATAIVYGGIGGRPAFPRPDNPRTDDIFIHSLEPGAVQDEGVMVINNSTAEKSMMVYSADSTPSTDGGFACTQLADPQEGVGTWIEFGSPRNPDEEKKAEPRLPDARDEDGDGLTNKEENERGTNPRQTDTDNDGVGDEEEVKLGTNPRQPVVVTVAAGHRLLIPFTISVPITAGIGEHNGCVLIQERKDPSSLQEGISIATRTGLRVAVTVPGIIVRKLTVAGFSVLPRPQGGIILRPSVKNEGNVSVDTKVDVTTTNFISRSLRNYGGEYTVLRGDTSEWNFEVPRTFWGGWHRARLTVQYYADPANEPGKKVGSPTILTGPVVTFFLMPAAGAWILSGGILALVLMLLGLWWLARKRQTIIKRTWVQYRTKRGDMLHALAKKADVSWKLLARVNNVRAPYDIAVGTVLRVPPLLTAGLSAATRTARRRSRIHQNKTTKR